MSINNLFRNRKYLEMNIILFAILYLSVSFNKEVIRPLYGNAPFWGIISGSFSNFMAAYIVSLFSVAAILAKKIELKKAEMVMYVWAFFVFILLTIEEIKPFVDASKTYDLYDIIASAMGALLAVLTFEIFLKKYIKDNGGK